MPKLLWTTVLCVFALLLSNTATASLSTSIQANETGFNAHSRTFYKAAKTTDVDMMDLVVMASIESTMGKHLINRKSGASGLFGFTDNTWRTMIRLHGKELGIKPGTPRSNSRANTLLAAQYMKDNKDLLETSLHRSVGVNEVYMAHLLGPGGAVKLLKASNGRLAYTVIPGAYRNKTYFFDKRNKPYTVSQFKRNISNVIEKHRSAYRQQVTLFAFERQLPITMADVSRG